MGLANHHSATALSPVLIIAPQICQRSSGSLDDVARRIREIFTLIESRGHKSFMLAPENPSAILGRSFELARLIEVETPHRVCWLKTSTALDAYYTLWPKDGLCDWGSFVAVAEAPGLTAFAKTLGKAVRSDSTLCEGGMFVRTSDIALISTAVSTQTLLPAEWNSIRLPHPYSSDLYRRHQPEHEPLTHLDLDLALVPCADAHLLLVSERYNFSYRKHVAEIAERFNLEAVEISQDEVARRGLNLVVLSERAVLLPADCPQLSKLLSDRLGSKSIIEVRIDDVFNYNGGRGGLGCMSSVLKEVTLSYVQ